VSDRAPYVTPICTESDEPGGIVGEAMDRFRPVAAYACFSGGHDSLVSTHWAMANIPSCKVLHCNTGIGIEATRKFVRDLCRDRGWPLVEMRQDGAYERFVLEHGFPGPPQHPRCYQRLKERSIRAACKAAKEGRPRRSSVVFVSGIHAGESAIRSGYDRTCSKVDSQVWVNPFYHAIPEDFDDYRDRHSLPANPVKEKLGMSGECGCGAFAKKGELESWGNACPAFADRIARLESEAAARGLPWGWEDERPSWFSDAIKGQGLLPFMPFCSACRKRDEVAEIASLKGVTP
jgi:3'-phosphoadenosine 5'-phosphosulfate sulfotransferase (PAPS reductase)/FAD synthetase